MSRKLIFIIQLLVLQCASLGDYADVVISKGYNENKHIRATILPFTTTGLDKVYYDVATTDELTAHLIGLEYTLVERTQLERILQEIKLNYTGILSRDEIKKIGKVLGVDFLIIGNVNYSWQPSVAIANQYGAFQTEGRYYKSKISVRFVDVETGEIIVSGYVNNGSDYSFVSEFSEKLRKALHNRKYYKNVR